MTVDKGYSQDASKGLVLNARLLWTFAGAYRIFSATRSIRELADRAFNYIVERFWDHKNGGGFWMLHADGSVEDDTKMTPRPGAFFAVCVLRVRPRNGKARKHADMPI